MFFSLKHVMILIILVYLFFILKSVKRKKMRIGYLIFWSFTGLLMIISLIVPNLIEDISKFLGFEVPINMVFSIAIFIILYLIFDITTITSEQENNNVMLIQELSILRKKVDKLEDSLNKNKDE